MGVSAGVLWYDRAMAVTVQITFDSADPHALARFWAMALGYQKEDHTSFVDELLRDGRLQASDVVDTDGGRGFADVSACRDPADAGPRLFFQKVPESKVLKNRVHLDLHVGHERVKAEAARLIEYGATMAWTSDDRGAYTITLRDPEGNEFCVD
jgi:Glyoxalase-like domain